MVYSKQIQNMLLKCQKDEMTSSALYHFFAKHMKDKKNAEVLKKIGDDEYQHAKVWEQYTKKTVRPSFFKKIWYGFLTYVLGYTFVIKFLENNEYKGICDLKKLTQEIPEAEKIILQEEAHEQALIEMLDEERLNYVGAMVLGLNDALVELTGTIAGLTFVLMNTRLIAMAGIITGIAATLSMAASNYLAERADGNPKALKASIYTGIAYLVTVVLLVLPYLVFPEKMFLVALILMLIIVVLIVAFFNYYVAVVRSEKFLPKFMEMLLISLSVAGISFVIGWLAKLFFDLDVG